MPQLTRYQSSEERAILTGMIANDRVLSKIHAHLRTEKYPFRSKWCNLVGRWCLAYYGKYQRAPRASIESLFRDHAGKTKDDASVELIEKFLSSLSDDYKELSREINEDHLIDSAAAFFNQVRLERLSQAISEDLENKDVESAHSKVLSFNPVNLATSSLIAVLTDKAALRDAILEADNEVLIEYPGPLGEFFGPHLCRDGFVAFLAPEKRGKSFWLIDVAWRAAILNKRRTLLYSVGDMSQRQMMRRLAVRAARRPIAPGTLQVPRTLRTREGESRVRYKTRDYPHAITVREAKEAMDKMHQKTAFSGSLLRMRCTSNSSTRVADIRTDIDDLIKDGWVPDVVVIDYADILAPEVGSSGEDYRHQINETWKALRRMSQDYHMLVVTATQSDATSYESRVLRRKNFSEDKRKLSHVTGMVGINQLEEEKAKGVYRLNWILLREGVYSESRCVTTAGALGIANPAVVSAW